MEQMPVKEDRGKPTPDVTKIRARFIGVGVVVSLLMGALWVLFMTFVLKAIPPFGTPEFALLSFFTLLLFGLGGGWMARRIFRKRTGLN